MNPEARQTLQEGKDYLASQISRDAISLHVLLHTMPATKRGNDIVLGDGTVLPMLRSQSRVGGFRCLADFFDGEKTSPVGLFTIACRPKEQPASEGERLMSHAICARLAEACAEWLQQKVYGAEKALRVAFGYATCPDHSLKRIVFDLLDAERKMGITLNDHYAIDPSTSVCGFFISHPEARYFPVGRINKAQLADYCRRRGITQEEGESLLSKYITK